MANIYFADLSAFAVQMDQAAPADATCAATYFYVANTRTSCWKCHQATTVWGVLLPAPFLLIGAPSSELYPLDGGRFGLRTPRSRWTRAGQASMLQYIKRLSPDAENGIRLVATPAFRPDWSRKTSERYWMNHCECCGMKIGDFGLHQEDNAPLNPHREPDLAKVVLTRIEMPIWADADCGAEIGYPANAILHSK